MKKGMLFLFACLAVGIVGNVSAYKLKIINKTGKQLKVEAIYYGPAACGADEFNVGRTETKTSEKGICCLRYVRARRVEGSNLKWSEKAEGTTTFLGMACSSNTFEAIELQNGSLILERK